jgi:hypothetical protein
MGGLICDLQARLRQVEHLTALHARDHLSA